MDNKKNILSGIDRINLEDLYKLAQANPKYSKMLQGLYSIDVIIKNFVSNTIDENDDSSLYYIKTELMSQCYNLYLYSIERQAIVGVTWELTDFLTKCETKLIEADVEKKTLKMLNKFQQQKLMLGERINWVN